MIQYHPILSFLDQFPNSQGTWNSRWSQRTWWASNVSPPWIYLSDPRPFPTAFGSPNCRRSDSPPGDSMILFACLMKSKIAWTWRIEHIFHDAKWAIFASLKLSEMTSEAPPWWFEEPQGRLPRNSSPLSATHLGKRHHDITRGMSVRKCRLDGGCWDASRACDHYDAGGAIPNFIVLGLADVNQDPCSWMDLSWCDIWEFDIWFAKVSGYIWLQYQ